MSTAKSLRFVDLEPVGPGTPAGRYLRRFWHPLIRVRDLPKGRAKPVEILGEKFTVYRAEDGTPHVTAFRCPHRGTQLSLGWVEAGGLRCRYHGWRFDRSGQCVEQPNEEKPFCAKVKLPTYPVREYCGLIFAYVGEGEPPAFPVFADLARPGVIVTDPPENVPCTFWNRLDNDMGHVPWVHKATAIRRGRPDNLILRREKVEETAFGYMSTRTTTDGPADEKARLRYTAYYFMPNILMFYQPTRAKGFEHRELADVKVTWTVPVNDGKFAAFDVTHTPLEGEEGEIYAAARYAELETEATFRWDLAEKVLAGELTLEELSNETGIYTCFVIEDYTTQVGQGPIAERGAERLGSVDVKPLLLRRLWLREVSALLAGEPLTEWKIPTEPLYRESFSANFAEAS